MPPFVGLSPRIGHKPWAQPRRPRLPRPRPRPVHPATAADLREHWRRLKGLSLADRTRATASGRSLPAARRPPPRRRRQRLDRRDGRASPAQAFDILTSSKLVDALDVTKEDPRLRARYGIGDMKNEDDGRPCCMDQFLMARRLVEAGARVRDSRFGRWDTHGNNFGQCRERMPKLDMALSALVEDLHTARARQGRLGRRLGRVRPHAQDQQGRRPRPLAARQLRPARRRRHADRPGHRLDRPARPRSAKDRPVTFQNVFATLYHNLGIAPTTTVPDRGGRPMSLLDELRADPRAGLKRSRGREQDAAPSPRGEGRRRTSRSAAPVSPAQGRRRRGACACAGCGPASWGGVPWRRGSCRTSSSNCSSCDAVSSLHGSGRLPARAEIAGKETHYAEQAASLQPDSWDFGAGIRSSASSRPRRTTPPLGDHAVHGAGRYAHSLYPPPPPPYAAPASIAATAATTAIAAPPAAAVAAATSATAAAGPRSSRGRASLTVRGRPP